MFSIEDHDEILRLAKVAVASQKDMDSIYHLYKRYINIKAVQYQTNCNCKTSIGSYYQQLLDWFSSNRDNFIIS